MADGFLNKKKMKCFRHKRKCKRVILYLMSRPSAMEKYRKSKELIGSIR